MPCRGAKKDIEEPFKKTVSPEEDLKMLEEAHTKRRNKDRNREWRMQGKPNASYIRATAINRLMGYYPRADK